MRTEDLRIGNYVDVVVNDNGATTRCKVESFAHETNFAELKDITGSSVFSVSTDDKWALVKEVATTENELKNLGFTYDPGLYLDMFSIKGAWFFYEAIVGKHSDHYELFIEEDAVLHIYKGIPVPSIHLLQNAIADNYGYRFIHRSSK